MGREQREAPLFSLEEKRGFVVQCDGLPPKVRWDLELILCPSRRESAAIGFWRDVLAREEAVTSGYRR